MSNDLKALRFALIIAVALTQAIVTQSLSAGERDEEKARSFVESAAALIYACAWPTATYENVSFRTFDPVDGGYDAVFRLSGKSAFGGGDLWVDLVFEFRHGTLDDMHVQRHNAILVPPFETCKAMGQIIDEAIKANQSPSQPYTDPRSSRPPKEVNMRTSAVCINNTMDFDMNYAYRWDQKDWERVSVSTGGAKRHWWTYPDVRQSTPTFEISFDDNLADGVTASARTLKLSNASTPVDCSAVKSYSFLRSDNSIGIASDSWQPGWPHPFSQNVVASSEKDGWEVAPGFRWYDPGNKTSLEVVPMTFGIVGIRIARRTEGDPYPAVISVLAGGPAQRVGLQPDMEIVRVDGVSMLGKTVDECVALLAGRPGAWLRIEARQKGAAERQVFDIKRE